MGVTSRLTRAATVLAVAIACGLVLLPAALADKTRINAADQAAAERDVLRTADLPTDVKWTGGTVSAGSSASSFDCASYDPSGSGLVDTGRASTKFTTPGLMVESDAGLLATRQMVSTDWKRTFVKAFVPCLRQIFARASGGSFEVVAAGQMPFAKLAEYVSAYRVVFQARVKDKTVLGVFDLIAMGGDRTEITLAVLGGIGTPANKATGEVEMSLIELRLAEILAARAFPAAHPAAPLAA